MSNFTLSQAFKLIFKFSVYKFNTEITGGKADDLRKWFGVEKILRNQQTNEYLFVNKVEEAMLIEEHKQCSFLFGKSE